MRVSTLEQLIELIFNISKYVLVLQYFTVIAYALTGLVFLALGVTGEALAWFPFGLSLPNILMVLAVAHIPIPLALAAVVGCQTLNMMSTHAYRTGQVADALWDQVLNKEPERDPFE